MYLFKLKKSPKRFCTTFNYIKYIKMNLIFNKIISIISLPKLLVYFLVLFTFKIPLKFVLEIFGLMDYYFLLCGITSCFLIVILCLVDNKNLPGVLSFIVIFTWAVFWSFLSVHFIKEILTQEFVLWVCSILPSFTLFVETAPGSGSNVNTGSGSNVNTGSDNTMEGNNEGKKTKSKPNLTVKTGPETSLEKDREKIGKCTHDKLSNFIIDDEKEVKTTLCDFEGENGKPDHAAFDSVTDNAFVCDNCHGIMCKDCVEIYSDEE